MFSEAITRSILQGETWDVHDICHCMHWHTRGAKMSPFARRNKNRCRPCRHLETSKRRIIHWVLHNLISWPHLHQHSYKEKQFVHDKANQSIIMFQDKDVTWKCFSWIWCNLWCHYYKRRGWFCEDCYEGQNYYYRFHDIIYCVSDKFSAEASE